MTFTPYQKATTAAKEAVIEALRIDEDTRVLSELWRHYLGLRSIEQNNLHHNTTFPVPTDLGNITINTASADTLSFGSDPFTTEMNFAAAGPVAWDPGFPGGGAAGTDIISFA
jgi:hypothetical protein